MSVFPASRRSAGVPGSDRKVLLMHHRIVTAHEMLAGMQRSATIPGQCHTDTQSQDVDDRNRSIVHGGQE